MTTIRIRTRYVSPTDTKGARIKATGAGRQITVPYDHAASNAHQPAAEALAKILGANGVRMVKHETTTLYGETVLKGYLYETV
jgi:hypothetical protein